MPENKYLKKFNYIDNKLRLIDKDGRLITEDGKHIDENGNFVKWEKDGTCTKVDPVGRAVNDAGDFDIAHSPFLDDICIKHSLSLLMFKPIVSVSTAMEFPKSKFLGISPLYNLIVLSF